MVLVRRRHSSSRALIDTLLYMVTPVVAVLRTTNHQHWELGLCKEIYVHGLHNDICALSV